MLRELRVRNFAVIDELTVELGPGLTVLTGETGAGKSILVEALALLVGGRPSADLIRAGRGRATVEGRFEIGGSPGLAALLDEAGVDADDEWLILKRELRREGRHRAWVNGSPSTTKLLRALGERLVDLHGQHEHQRLLSRGEQRRILDAFGGAADLARRLAEAYRALSEVEAELAETRRRAAEGRERADYLRFKAEEIEAATLRPGEDEELKAETRRLTHSEELIALSERLYGEVYEAEGALVDRLGDVGRGLGELARIDPEREDLLALHETALRTIEELGRELGEYRGSVEHDPARLEEVRDRLDLLYRLGRKYGDTVEDVIRTGQTARAELAGIEGAEDEIERLERARAERQRALEGLADELGAARRRAGGQLEEAIERSLPALGLVGGRFEVRLEPLPAIGPGGRERTEFQVSLNPGFDPAPLARVASGGEMSRLMLALKTALVEVDEVPVLVFDEIDAGIGGEVAHRVASRLARVAASHQVLVVTHLAQIAARADAHLSVDKRADGEATRTQVIPLAGPERVRELARMLGGDPESAASRTHAEELLAGEA